MASVRVFLPTYRRPMMLPRALASLRAQTHTDWICEVHNDDPTDPRPAELPAALQDPRLTLFVHPRNLGGTATFNLFFGSISEPFFSILEDDNSWEPDFLATMLAVAESHPDVTVFWANMHIAEEEGTGIMTDTGRTIWPYEEAEPVRLFQWGHFNQLAGALHSNGATLIRSNPGQNFRIPEVPFGVMEAFRERLFPFPLLLVTRPLATFTVTKRSARSRDPGEWAEAQALLVATFLKDCPWSEQQIEALWTNARALVPTKTTNLIMAAIAQPASRGILRYARWRDCWVVLCGFLRRPSVYSRLRASRRRHPTWWNTLEIHARANWKSRHPQS